GPARITSAAATMPCTASSRSSMMRAIPRSSACRAGATSWRPAASLNRRARRPARPNGAPAQKAQAPRFRPRASEIERHHNRRRARIAGMGRPPRLAKAVAAEKIMHLGKLDARFELDPPLARLAAVVHRPLDKRPARTRSLHRGIDGELAHIHRLPHIAE